MKKGQRNYEPKNLERIRRLRRVMTQAEKRLWYGGLRDEQLGFKFRRQYPFGPYALDFFCSELLLCIEVDGVTHEGRVEQDRVRDEFLARSGIETLRIWNGEISHDIEAVLQTIGQRCRQRHDQLGLTRKSPEQDEQAARVKWGSKQVDAPLGSLA